MQFFDFYIHIFTNIILVLFLGWYLITNLQWYNYKLERVIFKHHKLHWHINYFILPIVMYYLLDPFYFLLFFYFLYIIAFYAWNNKLDKSLVLTSRVKRFLLILLLGAFFVNLLYAFEVSYKKFIVFAPLIFAYLFSLVFESFLFSQYKKRAKEKLLLIPNLKIIAITASFGKTSIKNYAHQILSKKFKTYQTPRSVNTLEGLVLDVNNYLPNDTQVYIAEAGAREKGDIEKITMFLEPHYPIIGSVGEQHIEYFKTLDNIINTKMELLKTPRIIKGFVHETVPSLKNNKLVRFPNNLNITMANLDGIWFDLEINGVKEHFNSPILGSFNAINLCAAILISLELGMDMDEIKSAVSSIEAVPHRLQLLKANGKVIIDDSFNGNLNGMLEAIKLSSTYDGRKVIITPGLVESSLKANKILANAINEVFDLVILTGSLNSKILSQNIDANKIVFLKDKSKMQDILKEETRAGDLILFANDAPNFI